MRMDEKFFYDPKSPDTDPRFWDCECIDQYIHSENESRCNTCGAYREDQPDTRISELYGMHYKNIKEQHEKRRTH